MAVAPLPLRTKVRQFAIKAQDAPGTAEALTAAEAIAVFNLKSEPLNPNDKEERSINSGSLMDPPSLPGIMGAWKISGGVEVRGSGANDTAPEIGILFKAMGFKETISLDGTTVDYEPDNTPVHHTCGAYKDGIAETVKDMMGKKLSLKSTTKKRLLADFELNGRLSSIDDTALLEGVSFDTTIPPQFEDVALSIGAWSGANLNFDDFSLDIENDVVVPTSANAADNLRPTMITRQKVTGAINVELVKKSFFDIYAAIEAHGQLALSITIGSVAGNKLIITGNVILGGYPDGDKNGISTVNVTLEFDNSVKFRFVNPAV